MEKTKNNGGFKPYISYGQLGLIILFFLLGVLSLALLQNILSKETLQFSTLSLVAFMLSVLLAGSSIVLAISAIILGKTSEHAMTSRSDESIRLQDEVFIKTTEALQRIEASTGVTEKRIEDIISGRVGAISHEIADIALGERSLKDRKSLEQEIRDSLLREIKLPSIELPSHKEGEERSKQFKQQYRDFQKEVLDTFAALPGVQIGKIGDGHFEAKGDDLFDGIFLKNQKRIGVSVFNQLFLNKPLPTDYILKVFEWLSFGKISHIYLVIDGPVDKEEEARKYAFPFIPMLKEDFSRNVYILVGTKSDIKDQILKEFETIDSSIT